MIAIERCFNVNEINRILQKPSIAKFINDDLSHGCVISDASQAHWVGVYRKDVCVGVFLLIQHNSVTVEMHTALDLRGSEALYAAQLLMQYVFKDYQKLVTQVPKNNRTAKFMAIRLGFVVEGINRESFLINGELIDQDILGITKKEYESCQ